MIGYSIMERVIHAYCVPPCPASHRNSLLLVGTRWDAVTDDALSVYNGSQTLSKTWSFFGRVTVSDNYNPCYHRSDDKLHRRPQLSVANNCQAISEWLWPRNSNTRPNHSTYNNVRFKIEFGAIFLSPTYSITCQTDIPTKIKHLNRLAVPCCFLPFFSS